MLLAEGWHYAWPGVWPILTLRKNARKSPPYDVGKHDAALITRDAARKVGWLWAERQETRRRDHGAGCDRRSPSHDAPVKLADVCLGKSTARTRADFPTKGTSRTPITHADRGWWCLRGVGNLTLGLSGGPHETIPRIAKKRTLWAVCSKPLLGHGIKVYQSNQLFLWHCLCVENKPAVDYPENVSVRIKI